MTIFAKGPSKPNDRRGQRDRDGASGVGITVARLALGRKFREAFDAMVHAQWLTSDQLRTRSEERLAALLRHAATEVPFYREAYARLGLVAGALGSVRDLSALPVLTKKKYREQGMATFCAGNVPRHRFFERTTSGSSGEPFGFFLDREADRIVFASHFFYDTWHDLRPFDKRVRIMAPAATILPLPDDTPLSTRIRQVLTTTARGVYDRVTEEKIPLGAVDSERTKEIWRKMDRQRPQYVMGYTSALANIADDLLQLALPLRSPVKAVVTVAETLTPTRRRAIEEYFHAPIVNRYGQREFGWWVAQSCRESPNHFHINTELAVCEIVREDGSPCDEGETGHVLITDLHNYARPFIRYDTGDLASMSRERCTCGRGFPLLDVIQGRSIELLRTRNGRVVSPTVLGQYLFVSRDHLEFVRQYQLIQESPDNFRLLVVPTDRWSEARSVKLRADLLALLGQETRVAVETVREIVAERSGKRPIIKVAPAATTGVSDDREEGNQPHP